MCSAELKAVAPARCVLRHTRRRSRAGFTLAEVLVASAVCVLISGAMAVMADGIEQAASYTFAQETAHQHARVALERIQNAVNNAAATNDNPPVAVLADVSGVYTFPETLVVWRSDTNGNDTPQANELVVFCANPSDPKQLWELSNPSDLQTVSMSNAGALQTLVTAMKANGAAKKTVVTSLLRSCRSHDLGAPKPALRFEVIMRPSAADWTTYQASSKTAADWSNLPWAQGIVGSNCGLRQVRVNCELQVLPDDRNAVAAPDSFAVPFLGSAAMYYELKQ
jgi:Tfp pilus assembly protein PilV